MFTTDDALKAAIAVARLSPCAKSQRGVLIFTGKDGIISAGKNHPPTGFRCDRSDLCRVHCSRLCIHAEMDALSRVDPHLKHLELLHVKVSDGRSEPSGPPSCWQCSRHIIESPVTKVWLLHKLGLRSYTPEQFHALTLKNCGLPEIR